MRDFGRKQLAALPAVRSREVMINSRAMERPHSVTTSPPPVAGDKLIRGLGLLDSTMLVAGSMIGSGIFIVSADIARLVGSAGWLLVVWAVTGLLTVTAALAYGELAAMMPRAGGQYVYLREAYGPLWGFLYGWTLFLVIQTGTIAAVAVAFARFLGVFAESVSPTRLDHSADRSFFELRHQPFDAATRRDPHHRLPHVPEHAWDPAREDDSERLHFGEDSVAFRPDPSRDHYWPQRRSAQRQLHQLLDAAKHLAHQVRPFVCRDCLGNGRCLGNVDRGLCGRRSARSFRRMPGTTSLSPPAK